MSRVWASSMRLYKCLVLVLKETSLYQKDTLHGCFLLTFPSLPLDHSQYRNTDASRLGVPAAQQAPPPGGTAFRARTEREHRQDPSTVLQTTRRLRFTFIPPKESEHPLGLSNGCNRWPTLCNREMLLLALSRENRIAGEAEMRNAEELPGVIVDGSGQVRVHPARQRPIGRGWEGGRRLPSSGTLWLKASPPSDCGPRDSRRDPPRPAAPAASRSGPFRARRAWRQGLLSRGVPGPPSPQPPPTPTPGAGPLPYPVRGGQRRGGRPRAGTPDRPGAGQRRGRDGGSWTSGCRTSEGRPVTSGRQNLSSLVLWVWFWTVGLWSFPRMTCRGSKPQVTPEKSVCPLHVPRRFGTTPKADR